MSIHGRLLGRLALSTLAFCAATVASQAQDAAAVANRFKTLLEKQGMVVSWSSINGSGSAFALDGVKLTMTGNPTPFELGTISFEGVSEEDGGYRIETVSTQAYSTTQDGATVEVSPFVLSGVSIPAEGVADPIAELMFYEGAELAALSVRVGDSTVFSLENLTAEITAPAEGKPMEFTGAAEKFTADLTTVADPQSKAAIEALGLQTISGYFELAGSWQPTDGRFAFSQYDISVADVGTFGMTFDLGGYTPDFIKAMQDLQKKMAEQPEGADNSAQGLAMLGLMQQLTFNSASLRWDDDSITGKVIDFAAKQQNMKPEDIKNQTKAIVPFLTAQLNNPELSSQITTAVTAYVDDPKNLEVTAEPPAAVPFALLMAAGMSNPLELTKTLAVKVSANTEE